MASTGFLLVSNVKQIVGTLRSIDKYVKSVYIHLNIPVAKATTAAGPPTFGHLISQMYVNCAATGIEMSILVGPLKQNGSISGLQLKRPVDMMFSDAEFPEICEQLRTHLRIPSNTIFLDDKTQNDILAAVSSEQATPSCSKDGNRNPFAVYDTVVLGGTFDRLHFGHKILLTQAVLRTCRRLIVGVTTAEMTKSKTLPELILPVEQRIRDVREFLEEIDSSLQYDIVPIDDPFGPTKSDPEIELIVVSGETLRGGHKVNELRLKNNLRPLEIFCIDVVESTLDNDEESGSSNPKELKVSSSNTRIDILGKRIRKPQPRPHLPDRPYIIGLTGGIASGKSKMSQYFQEMGAVVLDCDKIAHEIYAPGQQCYEKIVTHFGHDLINVDGGIDRQKLGAIVFSDAQQLATLNSIVWPELMLEVKRRIQVLGRNARVVVIEAAILLRAGWESECHEVWSMFVPPEEAVRRVMARNALSEEDARKRIGAQLTNGEIVAKSNVVFSSQFEPDFTRIQAHKAWQMLMKELGEDGLSTNSSGNSML